MKLMIRCTYTTLVLAVAVCVGTHAWAQSVARVPVFEVDPTWPTIPNDWVLGEVTSISVDRNDNIWVLHVPQSIPEDGRANAAPPVLQFDAAGKLLTSWGGPGNGAAWPGREHGIFVDADDFVWIGGRAGWPRQTTPGVSDDMIMKFTMAGQLVMQIGRSGQSTGNLDTANVHQATDVFVDTQANEVYVADGYGNKRVIVFDSETGEFKRMWGAFGNPPPSTFAPNAPTPQPQTTPEGPPELGLPHAIKVSNDGVVYLADRINNRIQLFTREGKFVRQVRVTNEGSDVVPVPAGFAFSPDREQQFLYVVDSGPMRVVIFDRKTMTQIGVVGMRGKNAGEFDIVHHMAVDSKGNLYTAEIVNNRRAQKFVLMAALAQDSASTPQSPEGGDEVVVPGTRPQNLRVEIERLERAVYDRWNALNANDEFDIQCLSSEPTGSNITQTRCVPNFVIQAESDGARNRLNSARNSADRRLADQGALEEKSRQLAAEMQRVARQDEQFLRDLVRLDELRQLQATEREERRSGR